jgi:hypothetical protein
LEQRSGLGEQSSKLSRIRDAISVAFLLLFWAAPYADVVGASYVTRVILCCVCVFAVGFVGRYRHPRRDESVWSGVPPIALGTLAVSVPLTAKLAGVCDLPLGARYPAMLQPRYDGLLLAFPACVAIGCVLGALMFRRIHPGEVLEADADDYEAMPAQQSAQAHRKMGWGYVLVGVAFAPGLIATLLHCRHAFRISIAGAALSFVVLSFWAGHGRQRQQRPMRMMWAALGLIGPIAGFVGYYGGSRVQDAVHLHRALSFALSVAAVIWLPYLLGRIPARPHDAPPPHP